MPPGTDDDTLITRPPLPKLNLSESFGKLIEDNWRSVGGLTLLLTIGNTIQGIASAPLLARMEDLQKTSDPQIMIDVLSQHGSSLIGYSIGSLILTSFVYSGLLSIVFKTLSPSEKNEEWVEHAFRKLLPFIFCCCLQLVAIVIGMFFLILPGLFLMFCGLFAGMNIITGDSNPFNAIMESIKMSARSIGKTFVTWAMLFVLSMCSGIMSGLTELVLSKDIAIYIQAAVSSLFAVGIMLLVGVIYMDIKSTKPTTSQ